MKWYVLMGINFLLLVLCSIGAAVSTNSYSIILYCISIPINIIGILINLYNIVEE